MKLPTLKEIETSRDMIDVFKGYNHNLRIGEGEVYDMQNLTSSYYPTLAVRGRRGTYVIKGTDEEGKETVSMPVNPQGLIAKDSLCYVEGEDFVINEHHVNMGLSTKAEDCPKQLISMGAYVIIMPDKKWINTSNLTDFGSIEA